MEEESAVQYRKKDSDKRNVSARRSMLNPYHLALSPEQHANEERADGCSMVTPSLRVRGTAIRWSMTPSEFHEQK